MGVEKTETYKKRILFVGEASNLNTGFSTYYGELIPRLVATGKYEIAELGSYVATDDPGVQGFIKGRWKFYGVNPTTPEEQEAFNQADPAQPGQNTNQFGRYKFDTVLAEFRPDIVIDIRDWWMVAYQERSAFRKNFHWLLMPTVDSIPQKEEWIETYKGATYLMAYSDFGIDSLRRSSAKLELRSDPRGKTGFVGFDKVPGKLHPVPLRPGVDLKTFSFRDDAAKIALKQKWGIKPDVPIVLLVQRNQSRKRISEVMIAFARMKNNHPDDERIQKSILVMHTAWPDNSMSIDFPRAIARIQTGYHGCPETRKGIIREINSTFLCHNQACGDVFIAPSINLRQGSTIMCVKCGQQSAKTPTTGAGITREQLSEVYGMADMMVQMSIAEGCGMPVQEAKACGTPTLVTDYAAISEKGAMPDYEHVDQSTYTVHLGGEIMKVKDLYEEPETCCWRAFTDIDDCALKMAAMLGDKDRLIQMGLDARKCAEDNYDWEENWKPWEFIIDHITPLDRDTTWDKKPSLITVSAEDPDPSLSDDEFVIWCYTKLLGYGGEAQIDEDGRRNWMQKLAVEASRGVAPAKSRTDILNFFRNQGEALNLVENLRTSGQEITVTVNDEVDEDVFEAIII